jgi:hypothetical protein
VACLGTGEVGDFQNGMTKVDEVEEEEEGC